MTIVRGYNISEPDTTEDWTQRMKPETPVQQRRTQVHQQQQQLRQQQQLISLNNNTTEILENESS